MKTYIIIFFIISLSTIVQAPLYTQTGSFFGFDSSTYYAFFLGLIAGENSLMVYHSLPHMIFDFDYIAAIVGFPVGILFSDRGIKLYFLKPQVAHENGEFFHSLEVVFEVESRLISRHLSIFLKWKNPFILTHVDDNPASAIIPFFETGYSITDPSIAAGTGCYFQFILVAPVAIGIRYRFHYTLEDNSMKHGYGIVFSIDAIGLIYKPGK